MSDEKWHDLGDISELKKCALNQISIGKTKIALSFKDGKFGAVSGVCNHAGGPLGEGKIDGQYIVCPWHNWKFHCITGEGEPGYEEDRVPKYELKEENGKLFVNLNAVTTRNKKPHAKHSLERTVKREAGPIRVAGISTTNMDLLNPRYSTSDALLNVALNHAKEKLGAETKLIKLSELKFRNCEGYYSKSAQACTWPCSITQMDADDEMDKVYEAMIFWADVIVLSTPIRWGNAGSLYYKMIERMNCIQNQVTIRDRVLIQNKVASFIITGGQDNIQAVAGQMQMFFGELGFLFPQFPFIAHSRGWSAEDMENNIKFVKQSTELDEGAKALAERSVDMAKLIIGLDRKIDKTERGGRKAHKMETN